MEVHGDILKQLTKGMSEFGPEVEVIDGKLEIQYATAGNPEQKETVESFNRIATEFSRIPKEWSYSTATSKERKKYEKAKEKFENTKKDLLNLKEAELGRKEAMLDLSEIENKITLNQFLNTHPEVEKQLINAENKKAWLHAMKDIATERGMYMAAGFAARSLTMSMIGFAGLPLAAAGLGGFISRKRAKESLVEKEKMSRKGDKMDEVDEYWKRNHRIKVLNAEIEKGGLDKSKINEKKKKIKDLEKEQASAIREGVISKYSEAEKVSNKIKKTIQKLEEGKTKQGKEFTPGQLFAYKKSLRMSTDWLTDKLERGLIDFGESEERISRQYDLMQTLSKGFVRINEDDIIIPFEERRLKSIAEEKEKEKEKSQGKYLLSETVKGALISAGFATAGYAIREFTDQYFTSKDITSPVHEGSNRTKELLQGMKEAGERLRINEEQWEVKSSEQRETIRNAFALLREVPLGEMRNDLGSGLANLEREYNRVDSEINSLLKMRSEGKPIDSEHLENLRNMKERMISRLKESLPRIREHIEEVSSKRGLKENFTLELGKQGAPKYLERTLQMIAINNMENPVDAAGNFTEKHAAKSLNISQNLIRILSGKDTIGIKASELSEAVNWNPKKNTLEIKDHVKFNEVLKTLDSHADELWDEGALKKGALRYVNNIKLETWEKVVHAKGLEESVAGYDDIEISEKFDVPEEVSKTRVQPIPDEWWDERDAFWKDTILPESPEVQNESIDPVQGIIEKTFNESPKKVMDLLINRQIKPSDFVEYYSNRVPESQWIIKKKLELIKRVNELYDITDVNRVEPAKKFVMKMIVQMRDFK